MSLWSDIKQASGSELAAVVGLFMATVAPGTLILFHFRPVLLERLDFLKILLVSTGLTTPLLFGNAVVLLGANAHLKKSQGYFVGASAVWTSIFLYVGIAITYWWSLSFRGFVGVVTAEELLFAATVYSILARRIFHVLRGKSDA